VTHWLIAIAIALVAAVAEAVMSGPKPFAVLASFRQPHWALPIWGWLVVGAGFYLATTVALARMFEIGAEGWWPATLIVVVLFTDGFWNFLLFRLRRLDLAYLYLFPYALIVVATTHGVARVDLWASAGLVVYCLFLPYDLLWTRALARAQSRP
jgi:tryptophan-rich sensory protein